MRSDRDKLFTSIPELWSVPVEIKNDSVGSTTLTLSYDRDQEGNILTREAVIEGFKDPIIVGQPIVFKEADGTICGTGVITETSPGSFKVLLD